MESLTRIREGMGLSEKTEEENILLQAAAAMFGEIVDDLGPPLCVLSVRFSAKSDYVPTVTNMTRPAAPPV